MKTRSKKFILSLCLGLAIVAGLSCNYATVTEASPAHLEYMDTQAPPPPPAPHHNHKHHNHHEPPIPE